MKFNSDSCVLYSYSEYHDIEVRHFNPVSAFANRLDNLVAEISPDYSTRFGASVSW